MSGDWMSPQIAHPLEAYRLIEWPFREVPDPARCTFIAGRPDLPPILDRVLNSSGTPVSAIYLFWASLGAGKTHALYYLMNRMDAPELFLPIYSEYPEASASFVELYAKLARNIPWERIADYCFQLFASTDATTSRSLGNIRLVQPDIYRAFFLLAEGEERAKAKLANRWFRGEQLSRAELREASIATNLASTSDCSGVISTLAKLLGLRQRAEEPDKSPFRLVWIIDECQRLGGAPKRINQEINAGLQSTFNSTPDHLTLVLSFTGKPERQLPDWLKPELADRIGARNLILLPPLSREGARAFLTELLRHYRLPNSNVEPFFPFTEKAADLIVSRLLSRDTNALGLGNLVEKNGIRPRALIKYCHAVLQEHFDKRFPLPIDDKFAATIIPK